MAHTMQTAASTRSLTTGSAAEIQAAKNAATRLAIEARRDAALEAVRIEQAKLDRIDAAIVTRQLQTDQEQGAALLRTEQNAWQRRKRFDLTGVRNKSGALQKTKYAVFKYLYEQWRRAGSPIDGAEVPEAKIVKNSGRGVRHVRRLIPELTAYGLHVTERPRGRKGCHNRYVFVDYPITVNETGDDVVIVMDQMGDKDLNKLSVAASSQRPGKRRRP